MNSLPDALVCTQFVQFFWKRVLANLASDTDLSSSFSHHHWIAGIYEIIFSSLFFNQYGLSISFYVCQSVLSNSATMALNKHLFVQIIRVG